MKHFSQNKGSKPQKTNHEIKNGFKIILLLCFSFFTSYGSTELSVISNFQDKPPYLIKGTVIDIKGFPIPGATVRMGTIGTATDNNGEFSILLSQAEGILTFSCVGFKSLTKTYQFGIVMKVQLQEDVNELEEVTVVGYGTQRKDEVMGSVSVIKAEQLENRIVGNSVLALKGQSAGVRITQVTGAAEDVDISIRGDIDLGLSKRRQPLIVIDNVIASDETNLSVGGNVLTSINVNDIESYSVLKDAAATAIYGSRAANGVVMITTKQGKYNQKAQISANFSYTAIARPKLIDRIGGNAERLFRMEALENYASVYFDKETNTYKYPASFEEAYQNGADFNYFWNKGNGASLRIYQDSLNPFYNNSTDYFDYYFNPARVINANLQVRGGAQNIAYSVGLGYYDQTGTLRKTGHRRLSAFSNLSFKPINKLQGNFRFYLSYQDNAAANKGIDMFNLSEYDYSTYPDFLLNTSTVLPGKGTPAFDELTKRYDKTLQKNDVYRLRSSFDLTYNIIKGVALKTSVAVDFVQNNQNIFKPSELDEYGETYSSGAISRHLMLLNDNLLTYQHTFNDVHNFDALLGFSLQQDESNNISGYGKRAASDLIHYVPWQGSVYDPDNNRALKDFTSDYQKSTMVGIFGRINYNYAKKYFIGATLRRDASSRFGENVRWAWFPSYFVAWDIAKENFMNWSKNFLDNAKLRFSYGKTGRIFEFPYVAFGELQQYLPFMGQPTVTMEWNSGLENRNLTWEKTDQYDIGADFSFWGGRLTAVADYYLKRTTGMLYNPEVPGTHTAVRRYWQNMFGVDNYGFELELHADLIRNEKLNLNIGFNISKNWNILTRSANGRDFKNPDARFANNLSIIGKGLYGIYAFDDRGIYNSQNDVFRYWDGNVLKYLTGNGNAFYREGDRIIMDVDGNGQIYNYGSLADDRIYIGPPQPAIQGGFSSNLTYKNFDFNILFNYVIGKWILNTAKWASLGTTIEINPIDIAKPYLIDNLNKIHFWRYPGDKADFPRNAANVGLNNFASNLASNAQKVYYIQCQTITLGYTIRKSIFNNTRIFFNVENPFTITNYKGNNPENTDPATGIDRANALPVSRQFTFGISKEF